jgi:hypothetical protein
MFEELDPKNQSGKDNQELKAPEDLYEKKIDLNEKKVDDIFRDTEPFQKPSILQPKSADQIAREGVALAEEEKRASLRNLLYLTVAAVIFLVIAIGGYFFVISLLSREKAVEQNSVNTTESINVIKDDTDINNINSNYLPIEPVATEQDNIDENNGIIEEEIDKDTDQDGLLDSEEISIGTDFNLVDTDGDGLFDREEVKIYRTDPLNPDTDADGYKDGEEVKGGYNPNGTGKLFEFPQ